MSSLSLLNRCSDKVLTLHLIQLIDAAQIIIVIVVVKEEVSSIERKVVRVKVQVL